jgi:hypothetical protein
MMTVHNSLLNGLIGLTGAVILGARVAPETQPTRSVAPDTVASVAMASSADSAASTVSSAPSSGVMAKANAALTSLKSAVGQLSHPKALESAFRSYFAFLSARPNDVKKPYLYFVDYGLPATEPRGYVFDMRDGRVVDGPFMVAHGRGSSARGGKPTRFLNSNGSNATSLGLFVAQATYAFSGKSAGQKYSSIGLRLKGVSGEFNDRALERGVVVHGAPYVTPSRAGQSEGCPALELTRAKKLIPQIANGGLVFLFAPDEEWMSEDPWLVASSE